jgi:transcriptional regulator with XRE-family HTH domain
MYTVRSEYDLGQRLGIILASLRRLQGLTQKELAAKAGVTQAEISLIEKGGRLRLRTLQKVSRALGRSLGETITYAEGFRDIPAVLGATRDFVARVSARLDAEKRKGTSKGHRKPRLTAVAGS